MDTLLVPPTHIDHHADGLSRGVQPEQLSDPARTFRILVEQANDAMIVVQDGKLVYYNKVHTKLFGFASNNTASDLFEVIAPEDRERVRGYYEKRLRGEPVPDQYELAVVVEDGRRSNMEVKLSVV